MPFPKDQDLLPAFENFDLWSAGLPENRRALVENYFKFTAPEDLEEERKHFLNVALISQRTGHDAEEVSRNLDTLYIPAFSKDKRGLNMSILPKDAGEFYQQAKSKLVGEKDERDTFNEGFQSAMRGEDVIGSLQAWQQKNGIERLPKSTAFTRGFLKAREAGRFIDLADELLSSLEVKSGITKDGKKPSLRGDKAKELLASYDTSSMPDALMSKEKRDAALSGVAANDLFDNILDELSEMTPQDRQQVYTSLAARVEAKGYDQKGFWLQMSDYLDKQGGRMAANLGMQAAGAADWASDKALQFFGMQEDFQSGKVDPASAVGKMETERAARQARRDSINEIVGNEIAPFVTGKLDPVKATVGWLPDDMEIGLIKAPGAVMPFMAVSAATGFWGGAAIMSADFAEQVRLDKRAEGMDNERATQVGLMAAPLMALTESLSNFVQLGRFTKLQKVLAGFTKPIAGGAGVLSRYGLNVGASLGMEFTEEQIQENIIVPALQNIISAIDEDMPQVGMGQIWANVKRSSPELFWTLLPTAFVFGGVMTAGQAGLSREFVQNRDMMMAAKFSAAQANETAIQPTFEAQIAKARSLWNQREGTPQTMEEAAKNVTERMRQLSGDAAAMQAELERRGIHPRVLHNPTTGGWTLTFPDESKAEFQTLSEAHMSRVAFIEDQFTKLRKVEQETLLATTAGLKPGQELAVISVPEVRHVLKGDENEADVQSRLKQGAALGEVTAEQAFSNAESMAEAAGDEEIVATILGSSINEYYTAKGEKKTVQRREALEDVLRITTRLYKGANILTQIEETLEGHAKDIASGKTGRAWLVERLRNYEQVSGDKLFADDGEPSDKQLAEAWSHLGQYYLVGRAATGGTMKSLRHLQRYLALYIWRAGLGPAMDAEAAIFGEVSRRAQKIMELKAAGKLGDDLAEELERQLGIDSQSKFENETAVEAEAIANEALNVGGASYSEENPGPNGETFSLVTPDRDAEYMAAVESGDVEKARAMVDAAAKAAGYDKKLFTGQVRGLTVIPEVQRNELPRAYAFLTDEREVAAHYSGAQTRAGDSSDYGAGRKGRTYRVRVKMDKPLNLDDDIDETWWTEHLAEAQGWEGILDGMIYRASSEKLAELAETYNVPMQEDGEDRRETHIQRDVAFAMAESPKSKWVKTAKKRAAFQELGFEWNSKNKEFENSDGHTLDSSSDLADAVDEAWEAIRGQGYYLQDALSRSPTGRMLVLADDSVVDKFLDEGGYDGYTHDDTEVGGITHIVFDPSQIKSADPVTRDESGKVIPLSQRFNPADDRITFSLRKFFPTASIAAQAAEVASGRKSGDVSAPIRSFLDGGMKQGVAPTGRGQGASIFFKPSFEPFDFALAYRGASIGQSSSMLPLDALYQQAKKQNPALTEADFGKQTQALYESGELFIEPGESPEAMKAALDKYGVRDSLGIPAMFARPAETAGETLSIRSGDFSSRMAAAFSPFQRNPELRMAIAQVAKQRALKLGAEWIEKSAVLRTVASIAKEQGIREALGYDERINAYLESLTPSARQELEFEPAALDDDPLVSAMLDYGKLMSRSTALKNGVKNLDEFDGVPWLPPAWYSSGSGITPGKMAKAMHEGPRGEGGPLSAGDSAQDLWEALGQIIASTKKNKAAHREAVQAYNAAKRTARIEAKAEAEAWAKQTRKAAGSPKAQRDMLKAALRTLDGILSAAPPEVRARVGGYVKLAGLATDEAMLQEIERRIEKLNVELEKWLKKEFAARINKKLEKNRSTRGKGGQMEGRTAANVTEQIDYAANFSELTKGEQDKEIAHLESIIENDKSTAEQIDAAISRLGIAELFYDFDNQDAGALNTISDWLDELVSSGRDLKKALDEDRREYLAALKASGITSILGVPDASQTDAENVAEKIKGSIMRQAVEKVKGFINSVLPTTAQQFEDVFGVGSEVGNEFIPRIWAAANRATDIKRAIEASRRAMLAKVFKTNSTIKQVASLAKLQQAKKSGVFILEGQKTESVTVPLEILQRLADGAISAKDAGLSVAEAKEALDQWAEASARTRNATIERETFPGKLKEIEMSEMQALNYWLHWNQEAVRGRMERHGWTEESIAQLQSFMSDETAEIGRWMSETYATAGRAMVDPVYRRLYHAPLPYVKNFAPTFYATGGNDSTLAIDQAQNSSGIMASFTKGRRPHNHNVRRVDAMTAFLSHFEHVSHWVSYVELLRDMKAVIASEDVQHAIIAHFGPSAASALTKRVKSIETQGNNQAWSLHEIDSVFARLNQARAFKGLSWRISPIVKQTSAMLNPLLADVPAHAYAIGLGKLLFGKLDVSGMWKSDSIQRRIEGGFSAEARLAMQASGSGPVGAVAIQAMTKGMMPMQFADAGWNTIGAAIAYDYYRGLAIKAGENAEMAERSAASAVDGMLATAAQPADQTNRSLIESSPNPFAKAAWMFQSESRKTLAIEYYAAKRLLTGKSKNKAMDVQRVVVAHVIMGAVTQLMSGWLASTVGSDDDEEREWSVDQWAAAIIAGPINGLFVVGDGMNYLLRLALGVRAFRNLPGYVQVAADAGTAAANIDDLFGGDSEAMMKEINRLSGSIGLVASGLFGPAAQAADVVFGNPLRDLAKALGD